MEKNNTLVLVGVLIVGLFIGYLFGNGMSSQEVGSDSDFDQTPPTQVNPTSPSIPPTKPPVSDGEMVACTMEAKMCPDGVTYVGRQGPNCEFAKCPGN